MKLDDVWGSWLGDPAALMEFLNVVNAAGKGFGIEFTGECGKSVEFLDITT